MRRWSTATLRGVSDLLVSGCLKGLNGVSAGERAHTTTRQTKGKVNRERGTNAATKLPQIPSHADPEGNKNSIQLFFVFFLGGGRGRETQPRSQRPRCRFEPGARVRLRSVQPNPAIAVLQPLSYTISKLCPPEKNKRPTLYRGYMHLKHACTLPLNAS